MSTFEYHVKIGQLLLAREGEVVKTVLGSCVGIALIWKRRSLVALAHCLLPEVDGHTAAGEARYVSLAVPRLIAKLGATALDLGEIQAVVAGGGRMMDVEKMNAKFIVGDANLIAARKYLAAHKIKTIAFESGGTQATKMRVEASTGLYEIEKIEKVA